MLQLLMCGQWDGVSLWLQWDSAIGVEVQVRLRPGPKGVPLPGMTGDPMAWGDWTNVGVGTSRAWLVLPLWKYDWQAQARARVGGGDWQSAREVTFSRCRCTFAFELDAAARNPIVFQPDQTVSAMVDGAACSYRVVEAFSVAPGQRVDSVLEAVQMTSFMQLDYAGHFDRKAGLHLRIFNTGPSCDDTADTGRDWTELVPAHPGGPMTLVKTGNNSLLA